MRFLHTADWHIGQLFYSYDRSYEHQQFLNWLVNIVVVEKIDVLMISGDVFDISNPASSSIKMFYTFLNQVTRESKNTQIIVVAGNHDSASRLESPTPLLESSEIHIIGLVEKSENGHFNYDKLTIPLKDSSGVIRAWCLAVPFLRMGDYPIVSDSENPYIDGVSKFYQEAYESVLPKRQEGQAIIAMGHLHAQQAEVTDLDKTERLIMGGVECISTTAFNDDIQYVALGHIHKAQSIGGKENIRYSGSPLPMSFSERNYKHQVLVFEIEGPNAKNIRAIEVPIIIPVQSVPEKHGLIEDVLKELAELPRTEANMELAPYLEVRVLEDRPDPSRRHKIEQALEGKFVRLAAINVKSLAAQIEEISHEQVQQKLDELNPADIFSRIYQSTYANPVPTDLLQLFNQVAQEAMQTEQA